MISWKRPIILPVWLTCSVAMAAFTPLCAQERDTQNSTATPKPIRLTLNTNQKFQTIDNFGASDAWSGQFVGQWPAIKKNAIADLLFSRDTLQNGQPAGIGLSLWRFNIGAGTAEQGEKSGIKDEWRRAQSFLNADGTYDWEKQKGQIWFLNAAKQRGVSQFLGFTNSPPVFMTKNKKGYADEDSSKIGIPNLSFTAIDQFTHYLTEVTKGIHNKTGVMLDYLSPVNEPQWDWSNGNQEGTPFYNDQIAAITRSLSKSLQKEGLPTKIDIAEAGQIDFLYGNHNKPAGRGYQVAEFFQQNNPYYIGGLSNVSQTISGHSYFTTSPSDLARNKRQQVAKAVQSIPGLKYWMSEYCILGSNSGDINGNKRDLGIQPALYVAQVIHNDLVYAQASAWHWWLAISPYNYKDGLIYIDKNKNDGNFESSKILWALGQYSRFILPGAKRIEVKISEQNPDLLVSAYENPNQEIVTVMINPTALPIAVTVEVAGKKLNNLRGYQTSSEGDLQPIEASNQMTISPQSIITLVGQ
ncbi:glycoside hydrolase [Dyadobacter tibetensis]|uniref:glycoside hydrolase n=1 Tax=Dyadobacter tibetensis TaxID=1211851 RepID=UPI00046FFBE7|nr:glycoside hydrolase [Dyadobacter tibetensis]